MDYFSLWFSWLSLILNDTSPNETQQWLQLQGQRDFQHNFTSGKSTTGIAVIGTVTLKVWSYVWTVSINTPVSYITTNRSWKEQHIYMHCHHHHQSLVRRGWSPPPSQTLYTAFAKMSGIVMFVHYMVLSAQLLRCRPHLRTQSMVPSLLDRLHRL